MVAIAQLGETAIMVIAMQPAPCAPRRTERRLRWLAVFLIAGGVRIGLAQNSGSAIDPLLATNSLPLITTARELIGLSQEECNRHYPVRVRGTITFFDGSRRRLFARDETSGFWIFPTWGPKNDFEFGQLIEVTGVSEGPVVSAVRPDSVRLLGNGSLPPPTPVSYELLASGKVDCQWLELEGVVRTMSIYHGLLRVMLYMGDKPVALLFPPYGQKPMPAHLVGARIKARGVCSMNVAKDFHMLGAFLFTQDLDAISVVRPAATNAFDEPTRPVKSLLFYHSHLEFGDRVKVTGVVTLWQPGGDLYLRDEDSPLTIRLRQTPLRDDPQGRYLDPAPAPPLKPGDRVEVVGYTTLVYSGLLLDDAEYRRVGAANSPVPIPIAAADALQDKLDGELVSLDGRVLERQRRAKNAGHDVLLVRSGQTLFETELPATNDAPRGVASDAILRVTGINKIQFDTWNRPRSFRVLMRSPADVLVLKAPPFWTFRNALRLGALTTGVTLAALAWIGVLRRRVAQRTAELAQSNQKLCGEIEERKRAQYELARALKTEKDLGQLKSRFVSLVSHEFRTPLGNIQSSAGLLLKYFDRLALSRRNQLLGNIAEGTQRMAAMMEDVLLLSRVESASYECEPEPVSLADFCHRVVDEVQSATAQRCHLEIKFGSLPVARADTTLLRHLLTNLLTNAVKYSPVGATVELEAICANSHAEFIIRDHGIGIPKEDQSRVFEAFHRGSNVGETPGTGLGLVIVKRCVDLLCGDISIDSQRGRGTTVRVRLPVRGAGNETTFLTRESASGETPTNSTETNL